MTNTNKKTSFLNKINLKIYLIIALFFVLLALLTYYDPIHFKGAKEDFPSLGDYDYVRKPRDGNPNYYELFIIPSRYGYVRSKRTVAAAAADLALRMGAPNAIILHTKKHHRPDEDSTIIAQIYLYDARKGEKLPRFKKQINAYDHLQKEPFPIFLENLLE